MSRLDEEFVELAIVAERESVTRVDLQWLWRSLCGGQHRIENGFFTVDRWYLVLKRNERAHESADPALSRSLQILEHILCGESSKSVALDFAVAPSTVSGAAKQALSELGLHCSAGRVHPLLAVAAMAARTGRPNISCSSAEFAHEGARYQVVGVQRLEGILAPDLSPAELAVVEGLVEGRRYTDIARTRGTSVRTVANQVAAAFRRLRVSGRGELIRHLGTSKFLAAPQI